MSRPTDAPSAMTSGLRRWFDAPGNLRVNHTERVVEVGQLLQLDWHGAEFERAGLGLTRLIATMLKDRDPIASDALLAGRYRLAFRPYENFEASVGFNGNGDILAVRYLF